MHNAPARDQRTANAVRMLRALAPARRGRMPRKLYPHALENAYARELRGLTVRAVAPPLASAVRQLPMLVQQAKLGRRVDSVRHDAGEVRRIFDAAYAAMMSKLDVKSVANIAQRYAAQVSSHGITQLGRQLRAALGVKGLQIPNGDAPALISAFIDQNVTLVFSNVEELVAKLEKDVTRGLAASRIDGVSFRRRDAAGDVRAISNVALISNRPADLDEDALAQAIEAAVEQGGTTADLASEIEDRFGFSADHAEVIARDQIGKLNGQLDADRQQELGVTRFVWRTVGDERVRDEHEARDGQTYEYDDPPDGELPGEPINCRCSAEPVLEDILDAAEE